MLQQKLFQTVAFDGSFPASIDYMYGLDMLLPKKEEGCITGTGSEKGNEGWKAFLPDQWLRQQACSGASPAPRGCTSAQAASWGRQPQPMPTFRHSTATGCSTKWKVKQNISYGSRNGVKSRSLSPYEQDPTHNLMGQIGSVRTVKAEGQRQLVASPAVPS